MKRQQIAKAVIVTAEVIGHEMSALAAEAMADDLVGVDPGALMESLRRCRREVRGRLTFAAIEERLPGGHPGADEAWAMCPRGEDETVVWTEQMAQAWGVARHLDDDRVASRMAFRDVYQRLVAEAKASGTAPAWTASLGHDPHGREPVILAAIEAGRLTDSHARSLLPPPLESLNQLPGSEPIDSVLTALVERVR